MKKQSKPRTAELVAIAALEEAGRKDAQEEVLSSTGKGSEDVVGRWEDWRDDPRRFTLGDFLVPPRGPAVPKEEVCWVLHYCFSFFRELNVVRLFSFF